jgi:hypothetical protein
LQAKWTLRHTETLETRAVVRLRRFAALILTAGLASSAAEDARAEQPPKVKLFHGKKVVPKH